MGKIINTILGPKDVDALGFWSMHEHAYSEGHMEDRFKPMNIFEKSLFELKAYKAAGGDTITDCMPVGAHRDILAMKKLSEESGVNIVASTGFHVSPNYEPGSPFLTMSEDELFEIYYSELTEGTYPFNNFESELELSQVPILAGNVKAAYSPRNGNEEWFDRHLKAAARAAIKHDCTICVHTGGQAAVEGAEKLLTWGVRPEKILLCHTDSEVENFELHETLGSMGVYLEYDRLGSHAGRDDHPCYDEKVTALILHMVEKGYDKVSVSMDLTSHDLRSYYGNVPLDYTLTVFKDVFLSNGGDESLWKHMMFENPRNHFNA